jgi:DNA-binding CsgD family transcriptional regulator
LTLAHLRDTIDSFNQEERMTLIIPPLTTDHVDVLMILARGGTRQEAADHLGISLPTLSRFLNGVYRVAGTANTTSTVARLLISGHLVMTDADFPTRDRA